MTRSYPSTDHRMLLSHIQALELQVSTLKEKVKQHERQIVTSPTAHSTTLQLILQDSAKDPLHTAIRILDLVRHTNTPHYPLLFRIIQLCLNGPVGQVGQRRSLRAVAIFLLDHILQADYKISPPATADRKGMVRSILSDAPFLTPTSPHDQTWIATAKCLKGEILTSCGQDGYNDPYTPRTILQEGYMLFQKACVFTDNAKGLFLQGKWLLGLENLHRNQVFLEQGRLLVLQAVEKNCPEALIYLAQCLDSPYFPKLQNQNQNQPEDDEDSAQESYIVSKLFVNDCPRNDAERERYILSLYLKAAKLGNATAFNDIGACFVSGYASLEQNFDLAVLFYKAAIKHGCVMAYDNLGTHYETGMDGKYPDRIDKKKAVYYYTEGVKNRCPKCAHNLGVAFEEGMDDIIEKDLERAQRFYVHSLRLADDANDVQTATRAIKDLSALLITQIKLHHPMHKTSQSAVRRLILLCGMNEMGLFSEKDAATFLELDPNDSNFVKQKKAYVRNSIQMVERAIFSIIKSRLRKNHTDNLTEIVGEQNASLLIQVAKDMDKRCRQGGTQADFEHFKHLVGCTFPEVNNGDPGICITIVGKSPGVPNAALTPSSSRSKRVGSASRTAASGANSRKRRKKKR